MSITKQAQPANEPRFRPVARILILLLGVSRCLGLFPSLPLDSTLTSRVHKMKMNEGKEQSNNKKSSKTKECHKNFLDFHMPPHRLPRLVGFGSVLLIWWWRTTRLAFIFLCFFRLVLSLSFIKVDSLPASIKWFTCLECSIRYRSSYSRPADARCRWASV